MSTLLTILLAATAPAASPADEIVVIAQRFQSITASVERDPAGKYHCALDGTSGNLKLDGQLCKAVTQCVRKGAADDVAVKNCVEGAKPKLLADFKRTYRGQS